MQINLILLPLKDYNYNACKAFSTVHATKCSITYKMLLFLTLMINNAGNDSMIPVLYPHYCYKFINMSDFQNIIK